MNKGNTLPGCRSRLHRDVGDCGAGRLALTVRTGCRAALLALCIGTGLAGCAVNQATGERHLDLYGQEGEIAMGRQADTQIVASLGMYPGANVQSYAQDLGVQLAKTSERPDLPWTFRVIDDPVVNAFALPGGFIYVTRGLMTYVDNEAQLAGVVGHEIGHVTAQHSVHRMSTDQLTQIGVMTGMILIPELQKFGPIVNAGLGLLSLKYSRDDESQADQLGIRYMVRAEQDPRQLIGVFDMLARVSQTEGGGRLPEWLATHPNPENRSASIQAELDTFKTDLSLLSVNRNSYLALIDGMVFGPNPREGFFRAQHFYQPEMEFEFEFPSGWKTVNMKDMVAAVSTDQDAMVQITLAQGASGEQAALQFFGQEGMQSEKPVKGTINGLPAVSAGFRVQTEDGVIQGKASFVEYKGYTFQLLGYTTEQLWAKYQGSLSGSLGTFRRLTDAQILQVQPLHLKIITASNPSTLAELARQHNSPVPLETLAIINQIAENASVKTGDRIKMVEGEPLPPP